MKMNKTIKLKEILLYYDRIEIFDALDNIGGSYIATLVGHDETCDKYIVVGVNPERLNQFKVGLCDLRDLFTKRDSQNWYRTCIKSTHEEVLVLEIQNFDIIDESLLPDTGFFLHEYVSEVNELVLRESRKQNNFVLGLSLIPQEPFMVHKVALAKYKKAINLFEKMFRNIFDNNVIPNLDVIVPATMGSVSILFALERQQNLFYESSIIQSLSYIDSVNEEIDNISNTIEKLSLHKGHFVKSYRDLLEFIAQNNCSISYSWATPQLLNQSQRLINTKNAQTLFNELKSKDELTIVRKDLEGTLSSINTRSKNGSWTLDTSKGPFSGKSKTNLLKGKELTVNKNRYLFHCEETLKDNSITGIQEPEYILLDYKQLD